MSTILTYRIHPEWPEGTNKADRHNGLLGTVAASSAEDAVRKADAGEWKIVTTLGQSYTGAYRAVV